MQVCASCAAEDAPLMYIMGVLVNVPYFKNQVYTKRIPDLYSVYKKRISDLYSGGDVTADNWTGGHVWNTKVCKHTFGL